MTDLAPPVPAPSSTGGIVLGPQITGDLDEAARREWLVTDGRGGYAMGTAAFMRTRRYHGLLVVSDQRGAGRHLALASLDPVLLIGDRRVRLATDEWTDGVVDPTGHRLLSTFALVDGVPRWRWSTGGIVVECELAMARGRPATGVVYRILRAPTPVALEVTALCTWRDAHGTRRA